MSAPRPSRAPLARKLWLLGVAVAVAILFHWWWQPAHKVTRDGVARAFEYLDWVRTPPDKVFTAATLGLVLVWLAGRVPARGRPWIVARDLLLTLVYAAGFYWAVREVRHDLGDGPALMRDPVGAVIRGVHYTFLDELIGMWLPIRLAQRFFAGGKPDGMEPVLALEWGYQLVSVSAGVVFTGVAAFTSRKLPQRHLLLVLLLLGAMARLFAGYVENYSFCNALLGVVFLIGATALRRARDRQDRAATRRGLVLLAAALSALAVSFHAVAVWCVFALALYAIVATPESLRARALTAIPAAVVGLLTLAAIWQLFTKWVTPGVGFVHANRFVMGDTFKRVLHDRTLPEHAMAIAKVGLPSLVMGGLALVVAPRAALRLLRARDVWFALLWLAGFLVHQAIWTSTIGMRQDWDLFGLTWLPLAWLAWRLVVEMLGAPDARGEGDDATARDAVDLPVLVAGAALTVLAGLSWVATGMR
jgi:hypothetical protein